MNPARQWSDLSATARLSLTACGLGQMRPASGTWGSLPPCVALLALNSWGASPWMVWTTLILFIAAGSIACLRFGALAEQALGKKDPSWVVADEVAGMAITLIALPAIAGSAFGFELPFWSNIAIAFFAFRICDIVKFPPARGLQSLGGGLGILIDDLIAGAQAWILVQVAIRFVIPAVQ
ncbi:MAG: phosphatidylglycerophosphatase A [Planctomycetota bacterium]|nr:phosphatidylglycerophosphatase A [Planctomycetota bacterium]